MMAIAPVVFLVDDDAQEIWNAWKNIVKSTASFVSIR
jgi:hypothetical protein